MKGSKNSMTSLLYFLALLSVVNIAHAGDPNVPTQDIVGQQKAIRAQVETLQGRFADMPAVKRNAILAEQVKLFSLLDGKANTAELDPAQRTAVFNLQQSIQAKIDDREDERIVCSREKVTGSNRVTRVCKSLAQIKLERDLARKDMQDHQGICNSKVCSPNLN